MLLLSPLELLSSPIFRLLSLPLSSLSLLSSLSFSFAFFPKQNQREETKRIGKTKRKNKKEEEKRREEKKLRREEKKRRS